MGFTQKSELSCRDDLIPVDLFTLPRYLIGSIVRVWAKFAPIASFGIGRVFRWVSYFARTEYRTRGQLF